MSLLAQLKLPTPKSVPAARPAASAQPAAAAGAKPAPLGEGKPDPYAPVRSAAEKLARKLEQQHRQATEAWSVLSDKRTKLKARLKDAEGDERKALEAAGQELDAKLEKADALIGRYTADLDAIRDPSTKPAVLADVVRRNGSKTQLDIGATERTDKALQLDDKGLVRGWEETEAIRFDPQKGAQVRTKAVEQRLGADGLQQTVVETDATLNRNGSSTTQTTTTSVTVGPTGASGERSEKREIVDKQGRTSSVEDKTQVAAGLGGVSVTQSHAETNKDGSGTAASVTGEIKRGDGELSVGGTVSAAKTDTQGTTQTDSVSSSSAIVAGKDGLGVKQKTSAGRDTELKEGKRKGSRKVNFDRGLVANIVDLDGDGQRMAVTIRMSLGLGVEASVGGKGSKGAIEFNGKAGVEVVLEHTQEMTGDEAARYEAALAEASKGGGSDSAKEMQIIRMAAANGFEAARALYFTLMGERGSPADAANLQAGTADATEVTTSLGAGGSAQVGPVSLKGNAETSTTRKKKVAKHRDGTIAFEQSKEDKTSLKGTLGFKSGLVGGSFGGQLTATSRTGLRIVVDPKHPQYQWMAAALATCSSPEDIEVFAREYPDAVERTQAQSQSSGSEVGMSIGPAELKLGTGSALSSEERRDGAGRLIGAQTDGSSSRGGSVGIGDVRMGDTGTDKASTQVDEHGRVQTDLTHQSESTGLFDSAVTAAKNLGKKILPSSLGDALGGNAEEVPTEVKIAGITLDDNDLRRIGRVAIDKPRLWTKAFLAPKDNDEWEAAGETIRAADGDPKTVGEALSAFIGGSSRARMQAMTVFLRGGSGVSVGKRVEMPDSLKKLAGTYKKAVLDEPHETLPLLAQKKGPDAMMQAADAVLKDLATLEKAVEGAKDFASAGKRSEMLSDIRRTRVEVETVIGGMQSTVDKATTPEYRELLACVQSCEEHVRVDADLEQRIAESFKHYTRATEKLALLNDWEELYKRWTADWNRLFDLAKSVSEDVKTWSALRPDRAKLEKWVPKIRNY